MPRIRIVGFVNTEEMVAKVKKHFSEHESEANQKELVIEVPSETKVVNIDGEASPYFEVVCDCAENAQNIGRNLRKKLEVDVEVPSPIYIFLEKIV